jgi:hypothetical protein
MMNDPLLTSRLKLRRAHAQLKSLAAEIDTFIAGEPYQIIREVHIDAAQNVGTVIGRLAVQRQRPPEWSVVAGEIIHDLRSALDHLILPIVRLENPTMVASVADKTAFPIFLLEKPSGKMGGYDTHGEPKMLKGVSASTKALIKTLQPFHTGEHGASPLWHLHQLSNWDKHRELVITGAFRHPEKEVFVEAPWPSNLAIRPDGQFEDGAVLFSAELLACELPISERIDKVQMNGHLPFYEALQEPFELRGAGVVAALNA